MLALLEAPKMPMSMTNYFSLSSKLWQFQCIANFTTAIPTSNFPGYASGQLRLSEASMSRIRAGIHFKEDTDNGVIVGSAIGEKIVNDMCKIPPLQVNSD